MIPGTWTGGLVQILLLRKFEQIEGRFCGTLCTSGCFHSLWWNSLSNWLSKINFTQKLCLSAKLSPYVTCSNLGRWVSMRALQWRVRCNLHFTCAKILLSKTSAHVLGSWLKNEPIYFLPLLSLIRNMVKYPLSRNKPYALIGDL